MNAEFLERPTLLSLEWEELIESLASLAHSSLGSKTCRSLPFADDISLAELWQNQTTEMVSVIHSSFPLPELNFIDLNPALKRVAKGARLEAQEFREISKAIHLFNKVQECFSFHLSNISDLTRIISDVPNSSFVRKAIDRCISQDGEVLENASASLQAAIHESNGLKNTIRDRLQKLISSEQYSELLQEPYYAQRQSRYVLPIKTGRKNLISGIVHDESASGATVFIEPRELIDLNNRIRVADLQVTREMNRILLELSELVAKHSIALHHHLEVLSTLDCIAAKARLSMVMKGHPVEIHSRGRIHLFKARHPLLSVTRENIVPNDIFLGEEDRVLVISGPNTGGKTVALKLIGMFALMIKVGLHPPCDEGSVMGFFSHIFADVGDAQDLRKDLSSFSAHINNIVNLFATVQSDLPVGPSGYLVLLDEIMSSTDPAEGAALGEALLLELANMGLKVIVTTHYNALKILALSTPGFLNASLEIQLPSFVPTYRLIQGFPGGSSAFDIAAHLGLQPGLLEHARALLNKEDRKLETLFAELQDTQGRLYEELSKTRENRLSAEKAAQDAKIILDNLQKTEFETARTFRRRFRETFSTARQEIQKTLEEFRKEKNPGKAKQALKNLSEVNHQIGKNFITPIPEIPLESLNEGDQVEIAGLETRGILLESPRGKKRVRIKIGESEISTGTELLRGREKAKSQAEHQQTSKTHKQKYEKMETLLDETHDSDFFVAMTIDVRGQTAEEALEKIVAMLDQAALKHIKGIRIIHGHGTGRLKKVIRSYVSESPYVMTYRSGVEGEGGDGVTMVEMR